LLCSPKEVLSYPKIRKEIIMEHISTQESEIIRRLHLEGRGIHVIAHVPQQGGGCHSFDFLRGVMPHETYKDAYDRVKPDILRHIEKECGRSCDCNSGEPVIYYSVFGEK